MIFVFKPEDTHSIMPEMSGRNQRFRPENHLNQGFQANSKGVSSHGMGVAKDADIAGVALRSTVPVPVPVEQHTVVCFRFNL